MWRCNTPDSQRGRWPSAVRIKLKKQKHEWGWCHHYCCCCCSHGACRVSMSFSRVSRCRLVPVSRSAAADAVKCSLPRQGKGGGVSIRGGGKGGGGRGGSLWGGLGKNKSRTYPVKASLLGDSTKRHDTCLLTAGVLVRTGDAHTHTHTHMLLSAACSCSLSADTHTHTHTHTHTRSLYSTVTGESLKETSVKVFFVTRPSQLFDRGATSEPSPWQQSY